MPDNSSLSQDFVHSLHEKGYQVQPFATKSDCVLGLQSGVVHMCLVFPKDFTIENGKTNEIIFVVDKSRTNIVYEILESVSTDIGVQSDALSKSLTDKLTQFVFECGEKDCATESSVQVTVVDKYVSN